MQHQLPRGSNGEKNPKASTTQWILELQFLRHKQIFLSLCSPNETVLFQAGNPPKDYQAFTLHLPQVVKCTTSCHFEFGGWAGGDISCGISHHLPPPEHNAAGKTLGTVKRNQRTWQVWTGKNLWLTCYTGRWVKPKEAAISWKLSYFTFWAFFFKQAGLSAFHTHLWWELTPALTGLRRVQKSRALHTTAVRWLSRVCRWPSEKQSKVLSKNVHINLPIHTTKRLINLHG